MKEIDKLIEALPKEYPQEARRLFHGRSGKLPSWENLALDVYPPYILAVQYGDLPMPQEGIVSSLRVRYPTCRGIFFQDRRTIPWAMSLHGDVPAEEILVTEGPFSFWVTPWMGKNPGLFLDTRHLRDWLYRHSKDKKVLNLFSYTCSLSVAALSGGAQEVHNWDMKRKAFVLGRKNHSANHLDLRKSLFLTGNILKSFGKIKENGPYDILIFDPPPKQSSFSIKKDYPKLLRRAAGWLNPRGMLIAIQNSPFISWNDWEDEVLTHAPEFASYCRLTSGEDFEESNNNRQLKIGLFVKQA